MCLARVQEKKKGGGRYDKFSPAPILSFLLPERRFAALQIQVSLSALESQLIPSGGVTSGAAHGSAAETASVLQSLSPLR